MEDSMSSTNYKNKAVCSVSVSGFSSEGSSWSSYLNDSESECSSVLSDPGSSAETMIANDDDLFRFRCISKRRKIRASFVDNDLEDTASSPVRSTEVQFSDQFCKQLQETEYGLNKLRAEKQDKNDYKKALFSQEEVVESNQTGEVIHLGSTGLRKHGLCLVPVSMLFNF